MRIAPRPGLLAVLLSIVSLAAGCGSPSESATDGGVDAARQDDAGLDASAPSDAMTTDLCGDLSSSASPELDALPSSCLPRCAPDTLTAYRACPAGPDGRACRGAALVADTTSAVVVALGADRTERIDCNRCVERQAASCFHDRCPTEVEDALRCEASIPDAAMADGGMPHCADEANALQACFVMHAAEIQGCSGSATSDPPTGRVAECFDLP